MSRLLSSGELITVLNSNSPTGSRLPSRELEGLNGASTVSALAAPAPQKTAAAGTLGNIGNLRAAADENSTKLTRAKRYKLQNKAHNLVWSHVNATGEKRHSFTSCGKVVGGSSDYAEVRYNPATGDGHLGNVAVCESIACPVCAPVRAAKAAALLDAAIKAALQAGYYVAHVTYTMRHDRAMSLNTSQDMFLEAQQKLRRQRAFRKIKDTYGWLESVRVMEITRSDENGWHPHRHEVILLKSELSLEEQTDFTNELWIQWETALEKVGGDATDEYGLKATFGDEVAERLAEYVSKHGHLPDEANPETPSAKKRGGLALEAAGSVNKLARRNGWTPMQMLAAAADGSAQRGQQWLEYYLETKQRHWMTGVNKFCKAVGVDRESLEAAAKAEYLEEQTDYQTLTLITQEELTAVVALQQRDALLSLAGTGDADAVNQFLLDVMANFHKRHTQNEPRSRLHEHAPIWRRRPLFNELEV